MLSIIKIVQSVELIKRSNGYFITGRGCGTNIPLKYMNYIPQNLEKYECSFITFNNYVPIKGTNARTKFIF